MILKVYLKFFVVRHAGKRRFINFVTTVARKACREYHLWGLLTSLRRWSCKLYIKIDLHTFLINFPSVTKWAETILFHQLCWRIKIRNKKKVSLAKVLVSFAHALFYHVLYKIDLSGVTRRTGFARGFMSDWRRKNLMRTTQRSREEYWATDPTLFLLVLNEKWMFGKNICF